jgi:hypothetical protein
MTVLDQLGRWTMRVPAITRDELHIDVIAIAQRQGMRLPWEEVARLNRYQAHYNDFYPVLGTGQLPDPAWPGDLEAMARRAVDWLQEHAAPGRRFRLTDALYCDDTTARAAS